MNISIIIFFRYIGVLMLLVFSLITYLMFELKVAADHLEDAEHNRFLMMGKAYELRDSSNDLTQFIRMYAITGNQEYKKNYYTILDIRNGKIPKPTGYQLVYWDLSPEFRAVQVNTQKQSLLEEMKQLPFSPYERQQLEEGAKKSDSLVTLETQALNAMDGLYMDKQGKYTEKGKPNQALAIALLHSPEYLNSKEQIMLPINDFMNALSRRTASNIATYKSQENLLFRNVVAIMVLTSILLMAIFYMIKRKIIFPIKSLESTIVLFRKGAKSMEEHIYYQDEIGLMTKQFFLMKQKLDTDYDTIQEIAISDPLTSLKNRRYFFEFGEQVISLAKRTNQPLSVVIMDIDFFKKVNDNFGHVMGDNILKHLAAIIQQPLRASDIFARYGGEEFVILLPDTNAKQAFTLCEKLRKKVAKTPFKEGKTVIPITISMGIKELVDENTTNELVDNADKGLYKAKENGRNRVEIAK